MSVDLQAGTYRPVWKNRRRVIFGSLLYIAGLNAYLAALGEDTRVNETLAAGSLLLAAAIIGSYVFGAVWDDSNVLKAAKQ